MPKICQVDDCNNFVFGKGFCRNHQYLRTDLKPLKRISDKKNKQHIEDESLQSLIDDLDHVVSKYIRLKYADKDGMVECYTGGTKHFWKHIQCGHLIPRCNLITRWLEDNLRPQSEFQNCHLHGNLKVFAEKLEKEKSGITDYLRELSNQVYKPTRQDLKELLIEYRYKLSIVEQKFK